MPKIGRQLRSVHHPLEVIERAKAAGISRVAVAVSTGKDACATLHLCCRHFGPENVRGYFYYYVPGISFQDSYLAYLERLNRLHAPILRVPHPLLARFFRHGFFRFHTAASESLFFCRQRHLDAYVRERFAAEPLNFPVEWIATGEKCTDSLERNAEFRPCHGISTTRRRLCPLAFWSDGQVFAYLKQQRIALPPDYHLFDRRSFNPLRVESLPSIREHFPEDWQRILRYFPQLEVQLEKFLRSRA